MSKHFPNIQALRGLAASSVVIFHAGHFAAVAAGKSSDDIVKIGLGPLGVMMFFIISGFVITLNRHLPPAEFVSRRALRIYPAFWSAYALSAAIVAVAGLTTYFSWRALFLLPMRDTLEIHLPIWTLIFEVFFYAAATILFALRLSDRALTVIALCWVIVVQNMYPYVTGGTLAVLPGPFIPIAPYNVFFALGMIGSIHFERLSQVPVAALLTTAAVATAALPLLPAQPHPTTLLVLGVGLSSIMIASARIAHWPRVLLRLGDASYGLFLLHYAPMIVASVLLAGGGYSSPALFGLMLLIGFGVGVPFGLAEFAFHRAILKWLLTIFFRRASGAT